MNIALQLRFVAAGVLFILPTRPADSQSQYQYGTPEAAAEAVLRADSLHDWRLLLAMAHPDALEQHKREQLESMSFPATSFMPQEDPCIGKHLEAWRRMLLDSAYRVPSVDSLRNLPPDTVFARDQRFFGRWARLRSEDDSFAPTTLILGHVLADDSTAYVVLQYRYRRVRLPDWPLTRAEIMTFRRYQGVWRTMLDPHLGEGMGGISFSQDDCQ